MRISDWSSDVCSSDLGAQLIAMRPSSFGKGADATAGAERVAQEDLGDRAIDLHRPLLRILARDPADRGARPHQAVLRRVDQVDGQRALRSEEHTSELQSLMRISYAVFCLQKKNNKT